MWVQANQDSKGPIYGFGSESSKLKSMARLSVSIRPSSVKNYDAGDIATRFNESVHNQVERESREALLKKVDYLADSRKKDKSKMKMMWDFIKRHTSGPSNEPPPHILSSDDEDDGNRAPPGGDDQGGVVVVVEQYDVTRYALVGGEQVVDLEHADNPLINHR
ncbi:hypothetical protein Cgig2_028281 [Carnegiea gigantea]|uniref:Uncharacterized protein n=1 Tax=Carnegiea gigantea TaxID=171969 RepID=A0A9Q1GZI6_9CARY|nr:hypothetical protein Cgig2_028281 [Carnegiea gigantea]